MEEGPARCPRTRPSKRKLMYRPLSILAPARSACSLNHAFQFSTLIGVAFHLQWETGACHFSQGDLPQRTGLLKSHAFWSSISQQERKWEKRCHPNCAPAGKC